MEENRRMKTKLIITGMVMVIAIPLIVASLVFIKDSARTQDTPEETRAKELQGESLLLTEFGDFQCPHCARFGLTLLPVLDHELIRPGTVRFEYRHYPFLGPESFEAAEASECARDQGMFREYHDALLHLTDRDEHLTRESLVDTARGLKLDTPRFSLCLESGEKKPRVLEDLEYGSNLGVRGTPTLFLDGKEVRWRSYSDLKDQILRQAKSGRANGQPQQGP